jgi:hypothetical protein
MVLRPRHVVCADQAGHAIQAANPLGVYFEHVKPEEI